MPAQPTGTFLEFIQKSGRELKRPDVAKDLAEWKIRRRQIRRALAESWGGLPAPKPPPTVEKVGEFQREGYRVEKLLLDTLPGVQMTANAYVPDGKGPFPAVLCVHGHWRLAKQEPVVQSRCIGLAKLGFFVLMVDALGAGERGLGKALGEYHGEMVAGTLWPTGLALAGLQVRENMLAVSYMAEREEVDAERIGVTGCSGGGNQTMYVGAVDERLKAVVPVCSVGTYQSYLGAACCQCEVTPGAMKSMREADVLSLVAPRGLLLINATRDAFQFSVAQGKQSLDRARQVFDLYGKGQHAKQAVFESGHDYNQAMREAMYGWMTVHLKSEGDGTPIPEPAINVEPAEILRCFPGVTRPDNFVTLPMFAAAEAKQLMTRHPIPDHREQWESMEMNMRHSLVERLGLGGERPKQVDFDEKIANAGHRQEISFTSEPGITIQAARFTPRGEVKGRAILLDLDNGLKSIDSQWTTEFHKRQWDVVAVELRGTGSSAHPGDKIGNAPDHNTAEWSMWIGRPLAGQWVWDIKRLLELLEAKNRDEEIPTAIIGIQSASPVALMATALNGRVDRVAIHDGLVSFASSVPYRGQRMGVMVPGIIRDAGDIPQLAALASPRRLVISGGVEGSAAKVASDQLKTRFNWTKQAYQQDKAAKELRVHGADIVATVKAITSS